MPMRRPYRRRRKRRGTRGSRVNRKPRTRRMSRLNDPKNSIKIMRGMLPQRSVVNHRYTRQIRLTDPYILPDITPTGGVEDVPCVLIASCNNPMGPLNQIAPAGIPEASPVFLKAPNTPLTVGTWDRNRYPMLWQFLQRMYSQWTVIGSTIRVSFRPDNIPSEFTGDAGGTMFQMTLLQKSNADVVGATGNTFPSGNNYYPSLVKEQPGAYTKTWSPNNLYSGSQIQLRRNFSTRKQFGKSRGNVVAESDLQGDSSASNFNQLISGGSYPDDQYYWHLYINGVVSEESQQCFIPPGVFTVEIDYLTVWTERSALPDS